MRHRRGAPPRSRRSICCGRLDARPPAEDRDDVAELALERAAARELHRRRHVAVHLEQVVARPAGNRATSVRCACCVPLRHVGAARDRAQELRPRVVGLADETHVAGADELALGDRDVRAADRDDRGKRSSSRRISSIRRRCTIMPVTPITSKRRRSSQSISRTFSSRSSTDYAVRRQRGEQRQRARRHPAALVAVEQRQHEIVVPRTTVRSAG